MVEVPLPPSLPPSLAASPLKLRVVLHHQLFHKAQDLLHDKYCLGKLIKIYVSMT